MRKFFGKIKDWFKRHKPSKRRLIQVYAALLFNANIKGFISGDIYKGGVKNVCAPGLNCYSCPGASAACPLGALQNALANSGTKAPYYVIGIILLLGLIFGRTICGFLCPVGLGQELLYKIRTPKLKKSRYTRIASYLKYVILLVMVIAIPLSFGLALKDTAVPGFCKYICPSGTFSGLLLLLNPSNESRFELLASLFTWKFGVLCAMMVASVFIFRFFCRFFCPLGALYGFFSKIALLGVKLDKNKCTDCGICLNVCKMDIKRVGDHECIQCGECISACPAKAISWKGSKLFVHQNAVDAGSQSEEKPLNALLSANTAEITEPVQEKTVVTAEVTLKEETAVAVAEAPKAAGKVKKSRSFWLQLAAWIAALAVLVGALVYYNFVDDSTSVGKNVGDICPDFTVQLYDGEGSEFTLSETRGKVTVINFWAHWCGPCVAELPHFETLKQNYGDDVVVIAITEDVLSYDVQSYIDSVTEAKESWSDYAILFAQDNMTGSDGEVYGMLTDKNFLPVTVVLDKEGVIAYNSPKSITYSALEEIVLQLLN